MAKFLLQGIIHPRECGTILKTSDKLAEFLVKQINFDCYDKIIELGAGDGAITKFIVNNIKPNCELIAIDINEKFEKTLQKIVSDKGKVIIGDAFEFFDMVEKEGRICVISTLPFGMFPKKTKLFFDKIKEYLKEGDLYLGYQYAYTGNLSKKIIYEKYFSDVTEIIYKPKLKEKQVKSRIYYCKK